MNPSRAALALLLAAPLSSVADFNSSTYPPCRASVCFGFDWETVTVKDLDGFDPAVSATGRYTPLGQAAKYSQDPKVIEKLVADGGFALLVLADDQFQLVQSYEELDRWDSYEIRRTPLSIAARHNDNLEIINALIQAGDRAAHGDKGVSPLNGAALSNPNPKVASRLIGAGADVNASDGYFRPLHKAAQGSNHKVIELLLQSGADVDALSDKHRQTPLHFATTAESVNLLVDAGADVNARDKDMNTPMHSIVRDKPTAAAIRQLVAAGADIRLRTQSGYTPFRTACVWKQDKEILELLAVTDEQKNRSC